MTQTLDEKLRIDPPNERIIEDFREVYFDKVQKFTYSPEETKNHLTTPTYKFALKGGLCGSIVGAILGATSSGLFFSALAFEQFMRYGGVQTETSDFLYTTGGLTGVSILASSAIGVWTSGGIAKDIKSMFRDYIRGQKEIYDPEYESNFEDSKKYFEFV